LKNKKRSDYLSYLALGLSFMLLLVLNLRYHDHWLDSDMAAEMIFSKQLSQSGHFFATPDWYYSTEFRFLYTHWIMGPLFAIFGSWHVIRMITNLLSYALMLASYFFFMKPFKVRRSLVTGSSVLLLLPFSETMMTHMQMGNTYMFHVIIAFLFMGLFFRLSDPDQKTKRPWVLVLYVLISLICGVSGVRYLLALQCPLVLAGLTGMLRSNEFANFRSELTLENAKGKFQELLGAYCVKNVGYTLLGLVAAIVGYGINILYVCRKYVFQTYEETNFIAIYQGIFVERLQDAFGSLMMLFGYIPDKGVLSLRGLISILAFVLIVLYGYVAVRNIRQQKGKRGMLVNFFWMAFLLNVFVFVFSTSTMVPRYYILIYIFLLPLLCFYLEKEERFFDRMTVTAILSFCMILATGKVVLSFVTTDKNVEHKAVAAVLEEKGLSFGYATYWHANIITELTDGRVEVANVGDPRHLEFFRWSSPRRYYDEAYDGEIFLLLTDDEYNDASDAETLLAGEMLYHDRGFVILKYSSQQQLFEKREFR